MKKSLRTKKHTFFKYTLLWYLTSVLINFFMCIMVFLYVVSMQRNTLIAGNLSALKQNSEITDLIKVSIENYAKSIIYDKDIVNYLSLKEEDKTVYPTRAVALAMPTLAFCDQMISEYYIFDRNKELIFMTQSAYGRLEEFYEKFFCISGYSYAQWHDELLTTPMSNRYLTARDTTLDMKSSRRIPYISSILSQSGIVIGQALFFIDEEVMLDSLKPILDIGARVVCVTDETGGLIVSTSYGAEDLSFLNLPATGNVVIGGEKCVVAQYRSPDSGWTYQALIPVSVVTEGIRPLIVMLSVIMLVMISIGMTLAVVFAYRYSAPFRRMLERIRPAVSDTSVYGDSLACMDRGITNLLLSRENLEKSKARQKELLAETFLFRLMRGSFPDCQSIEQAMAHLEITLEADRFRGVLISLGDERTELSREELDRLDTRRALLTEVLREYPRQIPFLNVLSAQTIAVLYAEQDDGRGCAEWCGRVYEAMREQFDVPACFYVGMAVGNLQAVNESFASAEQMYFFQMGDVERFIVVADDPRSDQFLRCSYTLEDERRLLSLAATDQIDRIRALLEDIYARNFERQHMNAFMIRLLIDSMTNTLIKAVDPKLFDGDSAAHRRKLEEKIAEIPRSHSPASAFRLIGDAYAIVCDLSAQKKKNKSRNFIRQIQSYIEANYTDPDLSLEKAALEFGITSQYLSSFFKENTGENFSASLEELRIREANRLLDAQDLSVKELAQRVGYANAYTFRRAYSRVMGYTPSQHRRKSIQG